MRRYGVRQRDSVFDIECKVCGRWVMSMWYLQNIDPCWRYHAQTEHPELVVWPVVGRNYLQNWVNA